MALHWLVAVLALGQIALGWWMTRLPDNTGAQRDWFNLHKSLGITLGVLIVARLAWRMTHPAPALPEWMPRWQATAARVSHRLLYAALIAQPAVGFLGSSFTRYPIRYFGATLPVWAWDAPALKAICSGIHFALACLITGLIALHVAAALHHLARKDGVFERMWPGRRVATERRDIAARQSV
jgi:cytochrome b561